MNKKDMIFSAYAFFFNMGARRGVLANRVGLASIHNAHFKDGLGEVEREMGQDYCYIKTERAALSQGPAKALKFITLDAYRLGRSKYIFLNDNFMPLSKCKPNAETKIIQLWHGQGVFKKFGLHINQPFDIRHRELAANSKLSYVVCSSENVRKIYSEAFAIQEKNVISTGSPTSDYYFREEEKDVAKAHVYEKYPMLRDKKVVLYAPTFRDNGNDILSGMDKLSDMLGPDYEVIVRLHPQVHGNSRPEGIDVTDYDNVNELALVSDILITDYSSICMDFALQNKPIIFFAYDLDEYKDMRNFYFDYEEYVPGPIIRDYSELADAVLNAKVDDRMKKFREFNFGHPDGTATRQLLEQIL